MFSLKKLFFNQIVLLVLIVALGFFLRTYRLSEVPYGFHIDEAQVGYNAFSLLKTGRDETGVLLPTHLKIWDFERPLGIAYLSIPGILTFGLSELGTRINTATIGIISIPLVFLITQEIFKNRVFSLLSTFLFAISPWHINLSRATSDAVVCFFFFILGTFFAWKALQKNSAMFVLFSYFLYTLSFFSYYSTRLIIPVFLLLFFLMALKEKKRVFLFFILFLFIYLTFPFAVFWRTSISRFNQVSVFHEQGTKLLLEEQLREDGASHPIVVTRIFHNKLVNFGLKLSENFLAYFSSDFLIFKGGFPIRYYIPNVGAIYFWELPFLLWGIIVLFKMPSSKIISNKFLILFWVILGAFSASLTIEDAPNSQRALSLLPGFQWFVALGLLDTFQRISSVKMRTLVAFLVILANFWNISYFFHQYIVHSYRHRPWYRFYEMKELVNYLNSAKTQYKNIYLTFNSTEPYIYFLFYNRVDPVVYQELIKSKGLNFNWNNIGNIKIIRNDCPNVPLVEKADALIVSKLTCSFPKGTRIVKSFKYPDGVESLVAVDFPEGFSKVYENLLYEKQVNPSR